MVGATMGSYQIVRQIGEGGMGTVYLATHSILGRPAAIKVLLPELSQDRDIVGRFFNEARAATAIRHPGIIEIYDFGYLANGSAYIAMEFLEGETLSSRLHGQGRLSVGAALQIARQIASALHAAHGKGITHRDLKPDNVFLVPDPEIGERVKLLDFGIAKLAAEEPSSTRTRTGMVMGTPVYMSPEQCRGASTLDSRSDLYSLGCILYELLAGRPVFDVESANDIIAHHLYFHPEPVRTYEPSVPEPLDQLILALLDKDPAMRPATAGDVVAMLDRWRSAVSSPAVGAAPSAAMAVARTQSGPIAGSTRPRPFGGSTPSGQSIGSTPSRQQVGSAPPGQRVRNTPGPQVGSAPPGQIIRDTPSGPQVGSTPPGQIIRNTPPGPQGGSTPPGHAVASPQAASMVAMLPTTLSGSAGVVTVALRSRRVVWVLGVAVLAAAAGIVAIVATGQKSTSSAEVSAAPPPSSPPLPPQAALPPATPVQPAPQEPAQPAPQEPAPPGIHPTAPEPSSASSTTPPPAAPEAPGPAIHATPRAVPDTAVAAVTPRSKGAKRPRPPVARRTEVTAVVAPPETSARPAEPTPATPSPAPPTPAEPAPPPGDAIRPATPVPRVAAPTGPGSLDAVSSIGSVSVDGPLPDSEIRSNVERQLGAFRDCYRGAAKQASKTPALRITLSFMIDEGRAARSVRVSGDTLGLAACVKDAASRIRTRVAPDVGTATVSVVIKFQPTGS